MGPATSPQGRCWPTSWPVSSLPPLTAWLAAVHGTGDVLQMVLLNSVPLVHVARSLHAGHLYRSHEEKVLHATCDLAWGVAAGCPAAVANLWDVTDRDIDRFAVDLLHQWLPGEGVEATAEGRTGTSSASTAALCVSSSVARSRHACRLPHLIGAAPVCYGVPTSVLLQKQVLD